MKTTTARYVTREEVGQLAGQPSTPTDNLGLVAELPDGKVVLIEVDQATFESKLAEARSRTTVAA